jgi:hypothetical protein
MTSLSSKFVRKEKKLPLIGKPSGPGALIEVRLEVVLLELGMKPDFLVVFVHIIDPV